jgi:hypothetical protein
VLGVLQTAAAKDRIYTRGETARADRTNTSS